MSTVNLYDVLGVEENSTHKEIKKAYKKLVKKYHPDKHDDDEDNEQIYELITHAYNTLSDEDSRSKYDKILKLNKQSMESHVNMKDSFDEFIKAQENWTTKEEYKKLKEQANKKFLLDMSSYNIKHGFDENEQDKIDPEDAKKRLRDLELLREQDMLEAPEPAMDPNKKFNPAKFNAMWDKIHGEGPLDLAIKNKPTPFNKPLEDPYSTLDNDNLYDETNPDELDNDQLNNMSSINFGKKMDYDPSDLDIDYEADYYNNHNKISDDYEKELKRRMEEYENERENFSREKMSFGDFSNDCDGYGIFENLGIDISTLDWDDEADADDLKNKYNKLLEYRDKDLTKKKDKKDKKDKKHKKDKKDKKDKTKPVGDDLLDDFEL